MTKKEPVKRIPTSLRVITEMYETAKINCMKAHRRVTSYGSPDPNNNLTSEKIALDAAKDIVIAKISSEIEQYAVKKYPQYKIIIVPECHRSSSSGSDRLHIDLKVKEFPECKTELKAHLDETNRYKADMDAIEKWRMDALQAIAKKEDLPELPGAT